MNLAYILGGMSILSVVAVTSSYLVADSKKSEVMGSVFSSINQAHVLNLQKSKNAETIKAKLSSTGLDFSSTSPFYKCLRGAGSQCQTFSTSAYQMAGSPTVISAPGGMGEIQTQTEYKISCNNSSCPSLMLRLSSGVVSNSENPFSQLQRKTEIQLAGAFFADRGQISFDCVNVAGGGAHPLPTGIDLQTLRALCDPQRTAMVECGPGSQAPLGESHLTNAGVPTCPTVVAANCAGKGLVSAGVFGGQSRCVGDP